MSTKQAFQSRSVQPIPAELDSPRAKLVYLQLSVTGETSIDDLQSALDMQKITLFGILNTLTTHGFAEKHGDTVAPA
ncbi:TrmB family transcriptional regulator [Halostella sp. PRR32]|uniref:TrmB family transcriptional regulator n=1 Tax=Halostella sp. PRR32 TaxID=3098147 RepID=UPI002B1E8CCF|nr:TrmB family transcriptional regulator [Halostella sp. PRR32]